jgi:hypothetical protein
VKAGREIHIRLDIRTSATRVVKIVLHRLVKSKFSYIPRECVGTRVCPGYSVTGRSINSHLRRTKEVETAAPTIRIFRCFKEKANCGEALKEFIHTYYIHGK